MPSVTGFRCVTAEGLEIPGDAHGNNVAVCCLGCGHPLLLVTLPSQRGSDSAHPAKCRRCGQPSWADVAADEKVVRVRTSVTTGA